MGGNHHHEPANYNRAFAIGIGLNVGFVVLEAAFGFWVNSLSLLADAGHNLSDVLGLLLAWAATYLAKTEATKKRTFGLRRTTILAALLNGVILLVAVGGIAWEAIRRFVEPHEVGGKTMIVVAFVGIIINGATALLFMSGREGDVNIRGAFLHMAADAAVSLGVVLAGVAIQLTGVLWIDPLTSLIIALVIGFGTWGLLRDSFNLAVDAVPEGIDTDAIERYLSSLPEISLVHHLHVWGISTTEAALTVHLVKPDGKLNDKLLSEIKKQLHDRFGIEHATIQLEQTSRGESSEK